MQCRTSVIQRIDTERPAGQRRLARILVSVCVFVVVLANGDRGCLRRALARRIHSCHVATVVERSRAQVAFVAARSICNKILSEHAGAGLIGRQADRVVRAILDRHRQALRCQRDREGVHSHVLYVGDRVDIPARAVMDNDANGRFLALTGAVGDATERHVIGAAGLNVPELNAATVRRGFDTCPIDSRHIGDGGVAQICRKRGEDISP